MAITQQAAFDGEPGESTAVGADAEPHVDKTSAALLRREEASSQQLQALAFPTRYVEAASMMETEVIAINHLP